MHWFPLPEGTSALPNSHKFESPYQLVMSQERKTGDSHMHAEIPHRAPWIGKVKKNERITPLENEQDVRHLEIDYSECKAE